MSSTTPVVAPNTQQDPRISRLQCSSRCASVSFAGLVITAVALAILIALGASGVMASNAYILTIQATSFVVAIICAAITKMGLNSCKRTLDDEKTKAEILKDRAQKKEFFDHVSEQYLADPTKTNAEKMLEAGLALRETYALMRDRDDSFGELGNLERVLKGFAEKHSIELSIPALPERKYK